MNETCAVCGFDASEYTRADMLGTLRAVPHIWRTMVEDIDVDVLAAAPAPGVWSALQYGAHSRDVTGAMRYLLRYTLSEDHPVLGPVPDTPEPEPGGTMAAVIGQLDEHVSRVTARARAMTDADWARPFELGGDTLDASWIIGHAVHDATHHLRDVGRGLHSLGAGAPTQRGTLVQISASDGGVPKAALLSAIIDRRGVVGDRQAERKHHGKPLQALSLWSADVITALRAEGHVVHAGAAGENLTVTGIDWGTIRPGVRMAVGDVRIEISAFATPCVKNARWFRDRDFHRIEHDRHPGWSRVYAWVLRGGEVTPGADVVVEPDAPGA